MKLSSKEQIVSSHLPTYKYYDVHCNYAVTTNIHFINKDLSAEIFFLIIHKYLTQNIT